MKSNLNINLDKRLIYAIALCSFVFVFSTCGKKTEIIPPKAEITNIYNITDSTANVDVTVTQQSNAEYEFFGLIVDSTSTTGSITQVQIITFTRESVIKLNNSYSTKISKLKSQTQYSIHLYLDGYFDIGGPTDKHSFNIGEKKSFTTN